MAAPNPPARPRRMATVPAGRGTKWLVLVFWLVLVGVCGSLATKLNDVEHNDATTWLPKSAQSTKAVDIAKGFHTDDVTSAVVLYTRAGGLTPADRDKVDADRRALARFLTGPDRAAGVAAPQVSNRGAALLSVPLRAPSTQEKKISNDVKAMRKVVRAGLPAGLHVAVTGPAGTLTDYAGAFSGVDKKVLLVTVLVVALILLLTYRSPVLWLFPLLSVLLGSQVANGVVYLLAKYAGMTVNGQATAILTVLVFGAGTDYALLLTARYREELRRHANRHEAMAYALDRSIPAILASATTVVLGLLCLLAADMNSTRGLGPTLAVGIGVAYLVMTTLLPALLVILGRWVFWPYIPRHRATAAGTGDRAGDVVAEHGTWGRVARGVARRPRALWVVTAVVLAALALGTGLLKTGLTQREVFTHVPESVSAQDTLAKYFPAGSSAPTDVYASAAKEPAVLSALDGGVAGVSGHGPARRAGDWVHVPVVLKDAPDSKAAGQTVQRLRDALARVDGRAVVGGSAATTYDVRRAVNSDERLVIPLVLGMVLLVLMVLLRAVVAPLLLLASTVLSFFAALGASLLIFKAIGHPKVDAQMLPLVLFGFLFLIALGIDYTIFLMTRSREEVARSGHHEGVTRALAVTGGVITSAGLVLAATFSVLASLPVVFMMQLGILVALGVLLDTFVVRTILVPALSLDLGRRIWWPGRLARTADPHATPAAGRTAQPVRHRR